MSASSGIRSAPELLIRSAGVVLNRGCCSVLIFCVELRLTVTLPCFAAHRVLSNLGYSSPSPPLNTTTSTFEPSATPNGLSGDLAPVVVELSVGLPAQAGSTPDARNT